MKVANNLERISDEAQNIARRSRKLLKHAEISEVVLIEPVYEKALSLFRDAMRSYARGTRNWRCLSMRGIGNSMRRIAMSSVNSPSSWIVSPGR